MSVGFSTALLLDFHQSGVLQFPQGVHRFLPPTVEQVNHFTDRVIPNTLFIVLSDSMVSQQFNNQVLYHASPRDVVLMSY